MLVEVTRWPLQTIYTRLVVANQLCSFVFIFGRMISFLAVSNVCNQQGTLTSIQTIESVMQFIQKLNITSGVDDVTSSNNAFNRHCDTLLGIMSSRACNCAGSHYRQVIVQIMCCQNQRSEYRHVNILPESLGTRQVFASFGSHQSKAG